MNPCFSKFLTAQWAWFWFLNVWIMFYSDWFESIWFRFESMIDVLKFLRYVYTCYNMSISMIMYDCWYKYAYCLKLIFACWMIHMFKLHDFNRSISQIVNMRLTIILKCLTLMLYGWNAWCNCVLCLFDWFIFMQKLGGSILSLIILKLEIYTLKIIFAQFSLKMWILVFPSF